MVERAPVECAHSRQSAAPVARAKSDSHLPALTGLRFVLAIWVVIHHLTGRGMMLDSWSSRLPAALDAVLRSGYLAVSTFFVLSGFVLARGYGAAAWNRKTLARYAAARVARIYPVYLLSLLVVSPFMVRNVVPGKASVVAQYVFLLLGWTGTPRAHWNTPAWSLSCEMFFYACFPAAAVLIGKPGWRRLLPMMAAAWALPPLSAAAGVPDMWKPVIHLGDFLCGILAARAFELLPIEGRGQRLYLPALAAGWALIAWPGLLGGCVALGTALRPLNGLALIGLAAGGGVPARALSCRLAVYLGKSSYALYILHVPLLWWYNSRRAAWAPETAALLYVVSAVLIAAAVFRLVEEPANRRLRASGFFKLAESMGKRRQ